MKKLNDLEFYKYTALGNHFCLIDETEGVCIPEEDKLFFAQEYASAQYGVGCDSILFIQNPGLESFVELEKRFGKQWQRQGIYDQMKALIAENRGEAQAIMRVFEPCGQESAMCGNGIRCVADYLCRKWGLDQVRILAEVTTNRPRIYAVRKTARKGYYALQLETPRPLPPQFKGPRYQLFAKPAGPFAEVLDLQVDKTILGVWAAKRLRAYVIYTGEPHLVCFTASKSEIREKLQLPRDQFRDYFKRSERYRTSILQSLGHYLNDRDPLSNYLGLFNQAEGINVNIAEVDPERALVHMRVYERGIWGKTLSCGTGATAVAALAILLDLVPTNKVSVLTEGSFYQNQGSSLVPGYIRRCGHLEVMCQGNSWFLIGPVEQVYCGCIPHWSERLACRRREIEIYATSKKKIDHLANVLFQRRLAA